MNGDIYSRTIWRFLFLAPLFFVTLLTGWWWPFLVGAVLVLAQIIFQVWWEEADDIPDWMESVAEWLDDRMETFIDWLD
jgi:hypothetical protein